MNHFRSCFNIFQRQCFLILVYAFYFSISFQMISPSLSPYCSSSSSSSFLWVMRSERAPRTDALPNIRPIIGVPKESAEGEKRVAITPSAVSLLLRFNYSVLVEENAGKAAQFDDDEYLLHGATIVSKQEIWQAADIIVKVQPPTMKEAGRMRPDSRLIAFMQARDNADVIDFLHSEKNVTIFAMDQVPRNVSLTSRYFDAVYSQASIAGYRAVLEGISQCDKFLARATSPPLSTSEEVLKGEKVPPLNVLVLGGGISGIAAIKTARSLGASVACYDDRNVLRPLVTSLGASFFTSPTPYQENGEIIPEVQRLFPKTDLIICTIFPNHNHHTTAPRSSSPHFLLRKKTLLSAMPSGGVIVDMTVAPETGRGNVEGAEPDMIVSLTDRIFRKKLKIIGFTDFPSRMAKTSSMLYANNVLNVLFALHPRRDVVMKTRLTTSEEEAATAFIPSSTSSSTASAYWMGEMAEGGYDVAIDKIIGAMEVKDPVREVQAAVARVKTKLTSSTSKEEQEKETRATSQPQPLQPPLRSTSSSLSTPKTADISSNPSTSSSSISSSAYFYSYKNKTTKTITAETFSTPQIKSDSIATTTTAIRSNSDNKEKETVKSDNTEDTTIPLSTTISSTPTSSEKEIIIILPPQPILSQYSTITTTSTTSTTPINTQTEATNQPVTQTQTQTLTPPTITTTPQTTTSTLSAPTTSPNTTGTTTTNEQNQLNKSLVDDSSQAFPTLSDDSDNSNTAPLTTNNHETTETASQHNSINVNVNTVVNTSVKPLSTALPLSEKSKTKSPKKRMRKREVKNKIIDEQEEVRRRLRIVDMDENLAEQYSLLSSLSSPTVVPLTASQERDEVDVEPNVDVDDMDEEEYRYYYEDDRDSDSDPETDNDFDYIPEDEEEEDIAEMDPVRAMHTSVRRSQGEEGTGEEEEEVPEGLLRSFVSVTKLLIEFHTSLFKTLSTQIKKPHQRRRR